MQCEISVPHHDIASSISWTWPRQINHTLHS